jgi:hypothetical protein
MSAESAESTQATAAAASTKTAAAATKTEAAAATTSAQHDSWGGWGGMGHYDYHPGSYVVSLSVQCKAMCCFCSSALFCASQ